MQNAKENKWNQMKGISERKLNKKKEGKGNGIKEN